MKTITALGLVVILSGASCERAPAPAGSTGDGAGSPAPARSDAGDAASPAQPAAAVPTGSLRVVVRYRGEVPERTSLPVDIDQWHCQGKVFNDELVVDKASGALKNAVLRLESVRGPLAAPAEVTITNRDCAFDPRVSVAVKGAKVHVKSADPVLHTTHVYLNGKSGFNYPLPSPETKYPPRRLEEAGIMSIKCDVHRWMQGWMVIHDNPYAAVSDDSGTLSLESVPAGTHSYVLWHEKLAERKGTVTIEAGKTAELELELVAK